MKIGKPFKLLSKRQYFHYIDNYKKYTDFNRLGLYRSLLENKKLLLADKIEVRDYAHQYFFKSFEFLQVKDPHTYYIVATLGRELTKGEIDQFWKDIRKNTQKILAEKQIKHRNFGEHSKHNCGYEGCRLNGMMLRQGSWFAESAICFDTDKPKYAAKEKSKRFRKERKNQRNIIKQELYDA